MHASGLAEGTPHSIRLKAIHPSTMQELDRFEASMQLKVATQMTSEGADVTTGRALRSGDAWTRSRVERQMLLHNPFLGEGSRLSERSDEATEAMAIKWAINGLVTVQDALNDTGDDLMTTASFRSRWPQMAEDEHDYAELCTLIPHEWRIALRQDTTARQAEQEIWWTDGQGRFERY